jgi:hypothetical protein
MSTSNKRIVHDWLKEIDNQQQAGITQAWLDGGDPQPEPP